MIKPKLSKMLAIFTNAMIVPFPQFIILQNIKQQELVVDANGVDEVVKVAYCINMMLCMIALVFIVLSFHFHAMRG